MPKQSTSIADDPLRNRRPTIHEKMSGRPWDASYAESSPAPWDIGRPQAAISRLASRGVFAGEVLDAGCGTGEHTLLVASLGLPVLGVDVAQTALANARQKAADRGLVAEFYLADALHLERLGRRFDVVLDCGLFHSFEADERSDYATSLASIIKQGGTLYVLCFSDEGSDPGPHLIRQEELKAAFSPNRHWNVIAIDPERIETNLHANGVSAWLATMKRI